MHMKATADGCSGTTIISRCSAPGVISFRLVTMSAILGGNVRVGLEDNLYLGRGQLATSNADGVRKVRRILEELSLEIATPTAPGDAGDKGRRNVGF